LRSSGHTVHSWADRIASDICAATTGCLNRPVAAVETIRAAIERGVHVSLALPFEGVLVPDARDALRSGPDPELLRLLRDLSLRAGITVHVISGFDHETMDEWFDRIPAVLWAEHGLWRREAGGRRWRLTQGTASEWVDDVRQLMEQFVTSTPGAFVEARPTALTWHFGRADATLGQSEAQTLVALLQDAADFLGYEVTVNPGVVEVRAAGLSLHRSVQKVIEMNQTHQVVFVGAGDSAAVRDVLRASDILVDFSLETPRDPRRSRTLIRELADGLVPATREPVPVQERLRNASGYVLAGLSAVVPSALTASPATGPAQE
jgi:trehalose-phosphatase